MKFWAVLLAAVTMTIAPAVAQYEVGGLTTCVTGDGVVTNFVPAVTTNTYGTNSGMISANRQEYLPITVQYTFFTAPVGSTPTVKVRLGRSLDQIHWESVPFDVLTVTGATNTTTWITNITCAGIPFYRVEAIENTNSAVITNIGVWFGTKR